MNEDRRSRGGPEANHPWLWVERIRERTVSSLKWIAEGDLTAEEAKRSADHIWRFIVGICP